VISVVLYLQRRKAAIPSVYVVKIDESVIHRFSYPILKLWDYEEEIRSGRLCELALMLIATEKTEEVLQNERQLILQEKDSRKRFDLLATAVMVASRYFDINFLWGFFQEEARQMRESNFIEDWIQQGIQRGAQQKAQSVLIHLLIAKFGKLPRSVERKIRSITNEAELDQLILRILTANTLDEMGLKWGLIVRITKVSNQILLCAGAGSTPTRFKRVISRRPEGRAF